MKKKCDDIIKKNKLNKKVIFTKFISDNEVDSLMRITEFLIYPSMYEGFGLPVLEAMKIGTPVITSNSTAMPEIAGNCAVLIDPENIQDITEKMFNLLGKIKLKSSLIKKGLKRAEKYTWDKTADMYIKLYNKVIKEFKR